MLNGEIRENFTYPSTFIIFAKKISKTLKTPNFCIFSCAMASMAYAIFLDI